MAQPKDKPAIEEELEKDGKQDVLSVPKITVETEMRDALIEISKSLKTLVQVMGGRV